MNTGQGTLCPFQGVQYKYGHKCLKSQHTAPMVGMRLARFGALWCAAITAASAVATPDSDSFYQPTGDWQTAHAGDILAWRSIDVDSSNFGKSLKEAYQILYRTNQNSPDEPQHSVTTVLVPSNVLKKDRKSVV